jgi:hypothetical protein
MEINASALEREQVTLAGGLVEAGRMPLLDVGDNHETRAVYDKRTVHGPLLIFFHLTNIFLLNAISGGWALHLATCTLLLKSQSTKPVQRAHTLLACIRLVLFFFFKSPTSTYDHKNKNMQI